jgi:aarF domain-containing kinase
VEPPSLAQLLPRAATLALLFTPMLATAPLAYLLGERLPALRRAFFRLLTATLAAAGCAFIKWGQWCATRPDLFPPDLCAALSALHCHVPPHSWQATRRAVSEAFGSESALEDVFLEFDRTPVGSGSIAQVHRAVLRAQPTVPVAVKVRHPGVEARLRTDFALLGRLARQLESAESLSWLRLNDTLAQFAHAVAAQKSLCREGENLAVLRRNVRNAPHIAADFPTPLGCPPLPRLAGDCVLVETFEPGRGLDGACAAARAAAAAHAGAVAKALALGLPVPARPPPAATGLSQRDARRVVRAGKEVYLQMLLVNNFVHADLHPGNILLRELPGRAPQLVLVDAGMVDSLSPAEAASFVGLFRAMGAGDGRAAAGALLACGELQRCAGGGAADAARHEAFRGSVAKLFSEHCRGFRTGADVGVVLRATLGCLREHTVMLDGRTAAALVNLLCIESFASALQPQLSLLDGSELLLRGYGLLGPRALGFAVAAASPALAAGRRLEEALRWGLPFYVQELQRARG